MVYPKVKLTAFSGYVPRLPDESSTKKSDHHDSDEDDGMYNRLLSIDAEDLENAEVDFPENASSGSEYEEVMGVAEEAALDMVEVELSRNALTVMSLGELEAVDEAAVEEDEFAADLSGTELSSAAVWELDPKDEAKAQKDIFMAVEPSDETSEVENEQHPTLQSTSIEDKAISETVHESLKPEPMPLVRVQEQDKSIVGVPGQTQSIVVYSKPDQSIVASHRKDESVDVVPEQIQSIVGYSKSDQSIIGVPDQTKSIVGYSKAEQSVVHIPTEEQSIVGFHKQDLSIVGTSKESQTKKLDFPENHYAFRTEGVEAKEVIYTPQEPDGDMLHAKSDVDDLLQKHKDDFSDELSETITSKKINEEHLAMIEDQIDISMEEEQWIVSEEGIPEEVEDETEMGEDRFLHQLSEEESSWSEDEVGISEDEEQYEVEETSFAPAEQDIQESPQDYLDPQVLQRMLQELAEKNHSLGNMLFVFPEVVKADSTIDLYFNRDLSALANEPDVLIKGAFNGWKWKFFTEKLHKSELGGEWWSCKLQIPKEAYRLDFVFFNGRTKYENNGRKDFMIPIESTIDEHSFADFLVEEKQRELEREAERKNQTEEQLRLKEERAANEADRAQAKSEVQTQKIKLQNVLDSVKASDDNLWYIEPITTTQGATVRLYYNRHSRPLAHSTEIWMHGGYNNWIDGLSFSERLVHIDDKDGDWWYADGMASHSYLNLVFYTILT
jgi:hypothetical protein